MDTKLMEGKGQGEKRKDRMGSKDTEIRKHDAS